MSGPAPCCGESLFQDNETAGIENAHSSPSLFSTSAGCYSYLPRMLIRAMVLDERALAPGMCLRHQKASLLVQRPGSAFCIAAGEPVRGTSMAAQSKIERDARRVQQDYDKRREQERWQEIGNLHTFNFENIQGQADQNYTAYG